MPSMKIMQIQDTWSPDNIQLAEREVPEPGYGEVLLRMEAASLNYRDYVMARGGYGRRGGRAKRGDVRAAALALLAEEPMNGYQIIQQISERSGGLWRPSPGSVYPALAQLEDENLVVLQAGAGERRAYTLTEAGRAYVTEHAEELKAPWSAMTNNAATAAADLHSLVRQVHVAAFGVLSAGTDAQMDQARKILAQTRRSLYRILAEDEADPEPAQQAEAAEDRD